MRLSFFFVLSSVLSAVYACEGECINGTTNKFIEKYETPVKAIIIQTSQMIDKEFSISESSSIQTMLYNAYTAGIYEPLEASIFPGYFHGKCQQNGVDPPGCPNPDCPVVCGTPGSMVHFFPILRSIAHNTHRGFWSNCSESSSSVSSEIHKRVMNSISRCSETPRRSSRAFALLRRKSTADRPLSRSCTTMASEDVSKKLSVVLKKLPDLLADECDAQHNLSKCSWAEEMKQYILQFP